MKSTSIIICSVIILIFSNNSYSQSAWIQQHPFLPVSIPVFIKFVNPNTGFILTENYVMLQTTNGGIDWKSKLLPRGARGILYLGNIIAIPGNNGNNTGSTIYKSTDCGLSWSLITLPYVIKNLSMLDNSNWYASTSEDSFLKSSDGGNTWNLIPLGLNMSSYRIIFTDVNNGYLCGQGISGGTYSALIAKTSNSGNNWTVLYLTPYQQTLDMAVINDSTFFTVGKESIYTPPYGYNYKALILYSDNYGDSIITNRFNYLTSMDYIEKVDNQNYIAYSGNILLRTYNGGANWYSWGNLNYSPLSIASVGNNVFFEGCYYQGRIFKTTNNGSSWFNMNKAVTFSNLRSVTFKDANTGIAAGGFQVYYNDKICILNTTNGGLDWDTAYTVIDNQSYDKTSYIDGAFFACSKKEIKRSFTGENWTTIFTSTSEDIDSYSMINRNIGFVAFAINDILTTVKKYSYGVLSPSLNTNGGPVSCIKFKDANTGIVTTHSLNVYRTFNGGTTWDSSYLGNYEAVRDIQFINEYLIYARTNNRLLISVDDGLNWQIVGSYGNITSMKFVDEFNGYKVYSNKIYKTNNGGVTWSELPVINPNNFNDLSFINLDTGWVVGNQGTILRTNTGGIVNIQNKNEELPGNFLLVSNYPNPFNSSTNIDYNIPNNYSNSEVEITIFNTSGRTVLFTNLGKQYSGINNFHWDANKLPSGIYFIKITLSKNSTNTISKSLKAVLLK